MLIVNVLGENPNSIFSSSIKVSLCNDSNKVLDYKSCRFGIAKFDNINLNSCLILEVNGDGYIKKKVKINFDELLKIDTLKIYLSKSTSTLLQEIIVRSKEPSLIIKNDTTTYKIERYTDGTEKKLQDVLEKLPGIDVNKKTGEIKFKGRPISALMLDGDDLFGKNYVIGSKNINASMIEGVQAIENFSDNYVLKDFEKEENVALNIKLKKIPLKINTGLDLGTGLISKKTLLKDIKITSLGITNAYKFFNVFAHNNIGENNSIRNNFNGSSNSTQRDNSSLLAEKFIPETSFENVLEENRANINNQYFENFNGLLHITKKTSLKVNGFYTKDDLKNYQKSNNTYFLRNDTIVNIDNTLSNKKPSSFDGEVYLRNNISKKALFENRILFFDEKVNEAKNLETNFIPKFNSSLNTKNKFFKYQSKISLRVGDKNAFQSSLQFSNNTAKQVLNLLPSILSRSVYLSDIQYNDYEKRVMQLNNILYGKFKKGTYIFSLVANNALNFFNSNLSSDAGNFEIINSFNDVLYEKTELKQTLTVNYKIKRWSFIPSYTLTFLKQYLIDKSNNTSDKKSSLLFEPKLNLRYRITNKSSLNFTSALIQKTNVEEHIFSNRVMQSNRFLTTNTPSLLLLKEIYSSLSYSYRDLFNQFEFSTDLSNTNSQGSYLNKYEITDSLINENLFFAPVKNNSINISTVVKKYFPLLKSNFRITFAASKSKYNNLIGNGSIRSNINTLTDLSVFYRSAFKSKINFGNEFYYAQNKYFNIDNTANPFIIISIKNSFVTNLKLSKIISVTLNTDTYLPNLSVPSNNYNFIDFGIAYKPKSQKSEFRLKAKNLLNINSYSSFQNSDFLKSTNSISILKRYIAFNASFSF